MGNNKRAMLINLFLLISLFLVPSLAESRKADGARFWKARTLKCNPECESVYGVEKGDTCLAITQSFNMTTEFFNSINPNINCDDLFIGQWLCVAGSPC